MDYLIEIAKYLSRGAIISLLIFIVTIIFSIPLGIILATLLKKNKFLNFLIRTYTWFFRGTPLMLQLFLFMYAPGALGLKVNRMFVAYFTFIINYTAYFVEIIRAGIESIPKDQFESAKTFGATNLETYKYIILPQAIRIQLPVITNEIITLIKDTSLVTVIAISDLMRNVKEIVSRDFTISPFILASLFYLIISYLIVKLFRLIEKKIDYMDLN